MNKPLASHIGLRWVDKPMTVHAFEMTRMLPDTLQSALPFFEQIEPESGCRVGDLPSDVGRN